MIKGNGDTKAEGQRLYQKYFGAKENPPEDANTPHQAKGLDVHAIANRVRNRGKDDSFGKNFVEGVEQGTRSLLGGFAYTAGEVADRIGFDEAGQKTKRVAENFMADSPLPDDSKGQFVGGLIASTASSAVAIATANPALAIGSMGMLGVSSAGNGMMEYDAYKKSMGLEVDDNAKALVGLGYMAFEILAERISLGKMMPDVNFEKLIFKGNVKKAEKFGREIFESYAKKNPQGAKAFLNKIRTGMTYEGLEEVITEIGQTAVDAFYLENPDIQQSLEELPKNMMKAFIGGSIMGGGLGVLSFGAQNRVHRERRRKNGKVVLAQANGQPYEIIQYVEDEQNSGYLALNKNGEQEFLPKESIEDVVDLNVDQFDKLLQDKFDEQEFELSKRKPIQMGTYQGNQVGIITTDADGDYWIEVDGKNKLVQKELVEDIVPISPEEQLMAEGREIAQGIDAPIEAITDVVDAEIDADNAPKPVQDANGDYIMPGQPGYEEAKESAQPIEYTIGSGNSSQKVHLRSKSDGLYEVDTIKGLDGEIRTMNDLTDEEKVKVASQLNKSLKARGMNAFTKPVNPEDDFSPLTVQIAKPLTKEQKEEKKASDPNSYRVQLNEGQLEVINPKGEQVGSQSKYYLPKVAEFFSETASEYANLPRVTDNNPNITEGNYLDEVARGSDNPLEIAEAYEMALTLQESDNSLSNKDMAIANDLKESFVPTSDLEGRGLDKSSRVAFATYGRGDATTDIAQRAEYLSDQVGQEITTDDILDFMKQYPGGVTQVLERKNPKVEKLEERFQEVTGATISPALAKSMTGSAVNPEVDTQGEQEEDRALETKSEEPFLEDDLPEGATEFNFGSNVGANSKKEEKRISDESKNNKNKNSTSGISQSDNGKEASLRANNDNLGTKSAGIDNVDNSSNVEETADTARGGKPAETGEDAKTSPVSTESSQNANNKKPKSPEEKELLSQLKEAEEEYLKAKDAVKAKEKELNKGIDGDTENLFGERDDDLANQSKLFDVRADASQVKKALEPFIARREKAKEEVSGLRKQLKSIQVGDVTVTGEIDLDDLERQAEEFDYASLLDPVNREKMDAEAKEEELNRRREAFKAKNFDPTWAKTYDEAIAKEKKKYEGARKDLEEWQNKTYKSSKGSVFVGDELSGKNVSFNSINNKRKDNAVKRSKDYMEEALELLAESGMPKDERDAFVEQIESKYEKESVGKSDSIVDDLPDQKGEEVDTPTSKEQSGEGKTSPDSTVESKGRYISIKSDSKEANDITKPKGKDFIITKLYGNSYFFDANELKEGVSYYLSGTASGVSLIENKESNRHSIQATEYYGNGTLEEIIDVQGQVQGLSDPKQPQSQLMDIAFDQLGWDVQKYKSNVPGDKKGRLTTNTSIGLKQYRAELRAFLGEGHELSNTVTDSVIEQWFYEQTIINYKSASKDLNSLGGVANIDDIKSNIKQYEAIEKLGIRDSGKTSPKPKTQTEEATGTKAKTGTAKDFFSEDAPAPKKKTAKDFLEGDAGKPKQKTKLPKGSKDKKIEDFGDKIEGARKDLWSEFGQKLQDYSDTDLLNTSVTETMPYLDYKKLSEDGTLSNEEIGALYVLRKQAGKKPSKNSSKTKQRRWLEKVKAYQFALDYMLDRQGLLSKYSESAIDIADKMKNIMSSMEPEINAHLALGFPETITDTKGHKITYISRISGHLLSLRNPETGEMEKVFDKYVLEKGSWIKGTFDSLEDAGEALRFIVNTQGKKAKRTKLAIYKDTRTKEYSIGRRIGGDYVAVEDGFKDLKVAREYLNENYDALLDKLEKMKEQPDVRPDIMSNRDGIQRRDSEVSMKMFDEAFGFRGVQFGNYVEQGKRQDDLNDAYDSLMDLADILNMPSKAISLGGELGLAFGARGRGGIDPASAHYESGEVVINLTKNAGAGSLAHEWFHALDNYFPRKRGDKTVFITERPRPKRNRLGERDESDTNRQEIYDAFENLYSELAKNTDIIKRNKERDKTRSKAYFGTTREWMARSFEAYVDKKLTDAGINNQYLVSYYKISEFLQKDKGAPEIQNYPYPIESEMEVVENAFDRLFQTIKTKKTETDDVILFKKEGTDQTKTEAFKKWFGDSKVVDEDGEPLVVYHGGSHTITEFDEGWGGMNTADNEHGAFYFSDSEAVGNDYSKEAFNRRFQDNPEGLVEEGYATEEEVEQHKEADDVYDWVEELAEENLKVVGAYIKMDNPLIMDAEFKGLRDFEKTFNIQDAIGYMKGKGVADIEFLYDQMEFNPDDVENYREDIEERAIENFGLESKEGLEEYMFNDTISEVLDENEIYGEYPTYDGLIIKNVIDDIGEGSSVFQTLYIAIDPTQIKSATANNGNFDGNNPNILFKEPTAETLLESKGLQGSARTKSIKKHLEGITKDWQVKEYINIVNSPEELPYKLRERLSGEDRGVPGVYYMGNAYLLAYNIRNNEQAERTLQHEVIGHLGVRGLLNHLSYNKKDFEGRLANLAKEVHESFKEEATYKRIVEVYRLDPDRFDDDRLVSAQEYIAHLAEFGGKDSRGVLQKFKDWLNDLLKKLGFTSRLNNNDIRRLLSDARKFVDSDATMIKDGVLMTAFKFDKYAPTYYSKMANVLHAKLPGRGTPGSFKQAIEAFNRKGDFKTEELEWSGVLEWLDDQKGKITRDEVLAYLSQHNLELGEVVKGGIDVNRVVGEIEEEHNVIITVEENPMDGSPDVDVSGEAIDDMTDDDIWAIKEQVLVAIDSDNVTKYSGYQLEGGTDYKELLITLPKDRFSGKAFDRFLYEKGIEANEDAYNNDDLHDEYLVWSKSYTPVENTDYRNSHWDEPNVLAHVRYNTRGNTLFIEEIQSDLHQEGRKKGYKVKDDHSDVVRLKDKIKHYDDLYGAQKTIREGIHEKHLEKGLPRTGHDQIMAFYEKNPELKEQLDEVNAQISAILTIHDKAEKELRDLQDGVPNAPFKTTWHELAMKRMIREAVVNGYDRVAWTPGEVQNERYDLSRHVDSIKTTYNATESDVKTIVNVELYLKDDKAIYLTVERESGLIVKSSGSTINLELNNKNLSDVIGKDIAQKALDQEYGDSLSGVDLQVGGDGMKGFYDKILPSYVGKYIKKWGSKVEVTEIDYVERDKSPVGEGDFAYRIMRSDGSEFNATKDKETAEFELEQLKEKDSGAYLEIDESLINNKSQQVWSFPITDRMREVVVTEGQPLFKRTDVLQESPHQYQKGVERSFFKSQDKLIRNFQDKFVDVLRIQDGVKKDGGVLNDDSDIHGDATLHVGRVEYWKEKFDNQYAQPMIEELNALYKDKKVSYEDVWDFLYAKHAPERNKKMLERNPNGGAKQSGKSNKWAKDTLEKLEKEGKIESLEKVAKERIYPMHDFTLKRQLDSGMISKERFDELKDMFEFYVPLRGFKDMMEIDPTTYSGDLKMKGRDSEAGDILAYTLAMADTAIIQGEKNKLKQKVLNFAVQNYERSDLMSIQNVYWKPTGEKDADGKEIHIPVFDPSPKDILDEKVKRFINMDSETGDFPNKDSNGNPFYESNVRVMKDGRPVIINFKTPHIAHAINEIGVDKVPKLFDKLNSYMTYLRNFITQYSPEFAIRNVTRDSMTGFINLSIDFDVPTATKIVSPKRLATAWNTVRKYYRKGNFEGEWGEAYQGFMKNGGISGWWQLNQVQETTKNLQKAIEQGSFAKDWVAGGVAGVKAIGQFMDDYNRAFENVVRVSAYKYLLDNKVTNPKTGKPFTERESALYGKNLTVNFNRRGNYGNSIGSLFLFFNASIQGIARQVQPFFSDQKRTQLRAFGAPVVMAGTAIAFIEAMRFMMGMDEDDEYYYDKIPEWTRHHNIIFANPISDDPADYIKVPLPYGFNVYYALGDVVDRVMRGVTTVADGVLSLTVAFLDSYNPIGTQSGDNVFNATVKTVTPTVLQPGWELAMNTNFAGMPIKPEPFPFAPETPNHTQHFQYVSNWAKGMAKFMNNVSGGDEITSGVVDVSPEHIEYVAEYYGGGTARFLIGMLNTVENVTEDVLGKEDMQVDDIYDVPFLRSAYGKVTDNTNRSRFIDNSREIQNTISKLEGYTELDSGKAKKFYEEHKGMIELEVEMKAIQKQLRYYRKLRRLNAGNDDLKARSTEKELSEAMNELYILFNKRYNQVTSSNKKQLSDFLK